MGSSEGLCRRISLRLNDSGQQRSAFNSAFSGRLDGYPSSVHYDPILAGSLIYAVTTIHSIYIRTGNTTRASDSMNTAAKVFRNDNYDECLLWNTPSYCPAVLYLRHGMVIQESARKHAYVREQELRLPNYICSVGFIFGGDENLPACHPNNYSILPARLVRF